MESTQTPESMFGGTQTAPANTTPAPTQPAPTQQPSQTVSAPANPQTSTTNGPSTGVPQSPSIDPNQIAEATVQKFQQHQQAQQEQQMPSPEEIRQHLTQTYGVPTMTQEQVGLIAQGGDQAVAVMNDVLYNATRSAGIMSRDLVSQAQNEIMEQVKTLISEHLQPVQQQLAPITKQQKAERNNALFDQFSQKYPDLRDYRKLVESTVANFVSQGVKFSPDNIDAAFDAIAQRAYGLLNQQMPQASQSAAQPTQQVTQHIQTPVTNRQPRMAPVSMTGGPGSGGRASKGLGLTPAKLFASR